MKVEAIPFAQMDAETTYAMCSLRQQVFVVEQECAYPDLDGRDLEPETRHVLMTDENESLIGYARVLDDALGGESVWRVGRVVLTPEARGRGVAEPLMLTALSVCVDRDVVLDAQAPLVDWYSRLGFEIAGPEFHEDGIPHVPMRLIK